MDPWGGETNFSWNSSSQPHKYTTYERDANQSDDAMNRRYNRFWSRFDQPDPYDGSYDPTNPQSFNRYAYVQNDPVNFVDPSGLDGETFPIYCVGGRCRSMPGGLVVNVSDSGQPASVTGFLGGDTGMLLEGPEVGGGPQNPAAQPTLGPCNLTTPSFGDLAGHPALGLLSGPFDDDPEAFYNSLGTYNQAVLLNTTAALADAGVNMSNANFIGFYRGGKSGAAAFGIDVTGVTNQDLDKAGLGDSRLFGRRSPGRIKEGSLEATTKHRPVVNFDVDLYNSKSNKMKHLGEVNYNSSHGTTTHPGDVARQLAGRGVNSGVRCQ